MPRTLAITAFCLLGATLFCARETWLQGDGRTHVFLFDVGQGDGIMLRSPTGKQIVVDGGPDRSLLAHLGKEMPFLDRTIELLVLTHPDADHVTALPEVLRRYRVERILLTGIRHDSRIYQDFLSAVEAEQAQVLLADPALDIDMGDGLLLDIAWPGTGMLGFETKEGNDTSVVLRAFAGSSSILLTGDIEEKAEKAILASGVDIDADVLKVGHHGSKTSSSTGFLLAVSPKIALISVGRNNKFGHPHALVLRRFADMGIPVRTTAEEGTIDWVLE